ncbi:hypothetical protein ACJMK2_005062 [Sinanodonta woodiana]|uniref:Uncharacterized protein n=1 Tax=Sinanodonta woodiana TaxID=1069815 RepID=A0ABD3VNX5_SINWO
MDASTSVPIVNKKQHYCSVCSNYWGKSVDNIIAVSQTSDRLCSAHFLYGYTKEHNIPSIFNLKSKRKIFELSKCSLENSDTSQPNTIDLNADGASDFEESKGQTTLKTTCCSEQISLIFNDYLGAVEEKDMCRFIQKDIQTYPINVDCNEIGIQTDSEPLVTTAGTRTDDNHCSCQTDGVLQVASSTDIQIKQTQSIGIQVIRPDITFEDISDSNEQSQQASNIWKICVVLSKSPRTTSS